MSSKIMMICLIIVVFLLGYPAFQTHLSSHFNSRSEKKQPPSLTHYAASLYYEVKRVNVRPTNLGCASFFIISHNRKKIHSHSDKKSHTFLLSFTLILVFSRLFRLFYPHIYVDNLYCAIIGALASSEKVSGGWSSGSSGVPQGIVILQLAGGRAMSSKIIAILVIIVVLLVLGYPVWQRTSSRILIRGAKKQPPSPKHYAAKPIRRQTKIV